MGVKRKFLSRLGAVVLVLGMVQAVCASEMLLLLTDIKGSSRIVPGGIDVVAFQHGMSNTGTSTGGGAGRAMFQDIVVTKRIDKSSPLLYMACATGKHIPEATLFVRHTDREKGQPTYYVIKLEEVMISSCQSSGAAGEEGLGTEVITMNYAKIATDVVGDGDPVSFRWSLIENAPF